MPKYLVSISRTYTTEIEVDADDTTDAREAAYLRIEEGGAEFFCDGQESDDRIEIYDLFEDED